MYPIIIPREAFLLLILYVILYVSACSSDEPDGPLPIIQSFHPDSGIIGKGVTIVGNNFIPEEAPLGGPYVNTSIVKFNGVPSEAEYVYQDSIGIQRINTIVPQGATNGPITVTSALGVTGSSIDKFVVTVPDYVSNVTVSTVTGYGGTDVDIDTEGNLYVANVDHFEIMKIFPDDSREVVWKGEHNEMPLGIALDEEGNIYATIENTIRKIETDGSVTVIAGSENYGYSDGTGENARFWIPFGITIDPEGNLYIADLLNYRIRKVTQDGIVTTVAGSSSYGQVDGQGTDAQFLSPIDLTLNNDGNLYVSDGGYIRKVSSSGYVSTLAGTTNGFMDGSVSEAKFAGIRGIVVDPSGNILICDSGNYMVRRISVDGIVMTLAGSTFGYEDGPGELAHFGQTLGMTQGPDGVLYLTQGGGLGGVRKLVID